MNLREIQERFRQQMDEYTPSDAKPRHNRFEVESIHDRKNYVISLEKDVVVMYDTSRGANNEEIAVFGPDKFPMGTTKEECYLELYRKSLRRNAEDVYFLGYVEKCPETGRFYEIQVFLEK
jgi:hypothetical protein